MDTETEPKPIVKYLKMTGWLLIAILLLSATAYFVYKNVLPIVTPQKAAPALNIDLSQAPVTTKEFALPERPFDLRGTLYMSVVRIGGVNASGIYAYNINGEVTNKFTTLFADKRVAGGNYKTYISPTVSSDGKKLAFASGKADGSALQIFVGDTSGTNAQQVTSSPDTYKREPVFSPSGALIAYISHNTKLSATDPDPQVPESWSVYLTDLKGKAVRVASGVNPLFSPDGKKLLILENDGLHAFDVSTWAKPKPLGLVAEAIGKRASATMKLSVSPDGKMLAWSSVVSNDVVISRINSWDTFAISPLLTIQTKAYRTVFSPDGKYLAVQELRKDATSGIEYPVIMGYDLSNGKSEKIVTLTSDDKSYLWLGAWR